MNLFSRLLRPAAGNAPVSTITPAGLKEKLSAAPAPVLLDVREADELAGPLGRLDNIIHIPLGKLSARLRELEGSRDSEIVVICRSGARAQSAAGLLAGAGFLRVAVLEGGMIGWNTEVDAA